MENKEEIYRAMTREVLELLNLPANSKVKWTHAKADLIEMIYIVYLTNHLTRDDGSPATFKWMVNRIYSNLGLRVPANPVCKAVAAHNRKGVRQRPFEERYRRS